MERHWWPRGQRKPLHPAFRAVGGALARGRQSGLIWVPGVPLAKVGSGGCHVARAQKLGLQSWNGLGWPVRRIHVHSELLPPTFGPSSESGRVKE